MAGNPHSTRRDALPELGLERVSWVRIVLDSAGARCDVAGIAHRRPVLRPVPLRTAAALLAGGVPGVVRSDRVPGARGGTPPEGTTIAAGNGR